MITQSDIHTVSISPSTRRIPYYSQDVFSSCFFFFSKQDLVIVHVLIFGYFAFLVHFVLEQSSIISRPTTRPI